MTAIRATTAAATITTSARPVTAVAMPADESERLAHLALTDGIRHPSREAVAARASYFRTLAETGA